MPRSSKRSRASESNPPIRSPVSRSETLSTVASQQKQTAARTLSQHPSGRFSDTSAKSSLRLLPSSFRNLVSDTESSTVRSHINRIRQNLETTGSYSSSRSIASHSERITESVVDVGEDTLPTTLEELIARLEHHGVRRCIAQRGETVEDSPAPTDADTVTRRPYYYMCMPCEQRLTCVSARAATMSILQDVHHHVASAKHRRIAAWMGSDEIDFSLRTNPSMRKTQNRYTYIHVNGTPALISKAPGGGDLFQFLPHEMNGKAKEFAAGESMDTALTCANPSMEFMYCPLKSLTSRCDRHIQSPTNKSGEEKEDVIPSLDSSSHSVKLLSLYRAGIGSTLHYVAAEPPAWEAAAGSTGNNTSSMTASLDRTPVVSEGVYRAVVGVESEANRTTTKNGKGAVPTVKSEPLTRAALTLLSTSAGPEHPGSDVYGSDVEGTMNSQFSDNFSDMSNQ